MDNDIVEVINTIWEMEGASIAEKILDYCETYDVDERELGELLTSSPDFKKLLYKDCLKHNLIKDDDFKEHQKRTEKIEAW